MATLSSHPNYGFHLGPGQGLELPSPGDYASQGLGNAQLSPSMDMDIKRVLHYSQSGGLAASLAAMGGSPVVVQAEWAVRRPAT